MNCSEMYSAARYIWCAWFGSEAIKNANTLAGLSVLGRRDVISSLPFAPCGASLRSLYRVASVYAAIASSSVAK
jgi:hypothetical protein